MNRLTDVYVLLGSNVSIDKLRLAVQRLQAACDMVAVSSVYRSPAVGQGSGGPDYFNAAVHCRTNVLPVQFKQRLRAIESELGRRRDSASGDVAIDLDIILWGNTPLEYGDKPWRSPSPDLLRYAFVAVPLAELAPDLVHPETGQRMAEIARALGNAELEKLTWRFDKGRRA